MTSKKDMLSLIETMGSSATTPKMLLDAYKDIYETIKMYVPEELPKGA